MKKLRVSYAVRYQDRTQFEVAVLALNRRGEDFLRGFLDQFGEFSYTAAPLTRMRAEKVMKSRKARHYLQRGFGLAIVRYTTKAVAVAHRMPE